MSVDIDSYYEYTQKPWGKLFYRLVEERLRFAKDMKVLDFGSGLGITASYLAARNDVTAVEPDVRMAGMCAGDKKYRQITGDLSQIEQMPDVFPEAGFDLILCHNVLEYVGDRAGHISGLSKLLRDSGMLSVIKHNHAGRILHKIVFENNFDQAALELDGQPASSQLFGDINSYGIDELNAWVQACSLEHINTYGIRMFFGLIQNNEIKYNADWQDKMLALEIKAGKIEELKNIAFFHHIFYRKKKAGGQSKG